MKFKTRKNINEGFDNRTELIKKIDKFLYDNPEIEPPEGYVDSHSRNYDDLKSMYGDYVTTKFRYVKTSDLEDFAKTYLKESLKEDTVKQNGKWVNKGKEGTHGKFKTKKAADAQRRAIWVNWNK